MFRLFLILCITSILLIGCHQDRGTNVVDIMTDTTVNSDDIQTSETINSEATTNMTESVVSLPFAGATYDVFTSADGAINSEQFHNILEIAKAYNQEWCGKDEVPDLSLDVFNFLDEISAEEFLEKIDKEYSEH
ncbi:MAG: hypothetical protein OXH00_16635 [Candidatus Poribacteria bacterium]|nr:hypothetical protein [Candidatus Poribacteria bacterium]